jgi:hypothetical protein
MHTGHTPQFKEVFGEAPRREELTIMATHMDDEEDMARGPRPA